jgi:biotin-dependent carboxylase-like uncharacterized protein
MTAASIHVVRAGAQTTIQDEGRWGWQARGVPVAGPMDPFAHRLANALVGNRRTAATLEMALTGPELEFSDERVVAVTGAVFALTIDGAPVPHRSPFVVGAGARLRVGDRASGARAYVAIEGGFDVAPVLGSRATHLPSRIGGWAGRALKKGDRLPLAPRRADHRYTTDTHVAIATNVTAEPARTGVVRVLSGPDVNLFAEGALDALQSAPYEVTPESDRMGYRLAGPAIRHVRGADIISDATPVGSIQVPGSGQPVVLMADCATTGGYARLAVIIRADLGIAGQALPGDFLQFRVCSAAEALTALIAAEQRLMAIEARGQ